MFFRDFKKIAIAFIIIVALDCLGLYAAFYSVHQAEKHMTKHQIVDEVWTLLLFHNMVFVILFSVNLFLMYKTKKNNKDELTSLWGTDEESNYGSINI